MAQADDAPWTVLLPTTVSFDVPGHRVVAYDPGGELPEEAFDAEVLVLWGSSREWFARMAPRFRRLRLVQGLAAGPDYVLGARVPEGVVLATGQGLHDETVAEHALALILAGVRRLHLHVRSQLERRWRSDIGGLQPDDDPAHLTSLSGARVLIWGYGSIARTLAPLLVALGAQVTGVATSAREEGGIRVVAADDVDGHLPGTDVLVMILPGTEATANVLDERRIGMLGPRSWVVNVGRGSTIDEPALIRALAAGRLGGAALDVTVQEPLPPESPLWDLENVIITSHAAGGRPRGAAELVAANIRAVREGLPVRNRIR